MTTKLVKFDWAIKYLLKNKANFDILEGFLSELLKTPIQIEEVLESESNKTHQEDKFNRVDLLVKADQGKKIIVEVQCLSQWDYLSRILYGASKVVCEYIREGDAYLEVSKVISVNIVFFNLGEGKDYLYKGTTTFRGLHYNDILDLNEKEQAYYRNKKAVAMQTPENIFPEFYIVKVTKFQEQVRDKFDEWIYFLKNGEIKQEFAAKGIQSAAKKFDVLQLNPEERRAYSRYQDSLHDEGSANAMVDFERQEGELKIKQVKQEAELKIKEAKQEAELAELKAKQMLARKLLLKKLPPIEVANLTELSIEEVQQLSVDFMNTVNPL